MTLQQDTPGWCYKERLQDEAKWKAQDALKDTSRTENESRSGCSAGLDDQGRLGRSYHIGRCAQDANVQDEQAVRSQEKLSRMSREHEK
ncbi:hypothetical protein SET4581_20560 [Salmonella enterica subsp. enterica serovar Typhimurium str. ST4581]|nr:hypothetical protein SET4581_20560 [Salmonella enterica subsp. enterica serovar Typhimurium str. ST4581]